MVGSYKKYVNELKRKLKISKNVYNVKIVAFDIFAFCIKIKKKRQVRRWNVRFINKHNKHKIL